MDKYRVNGGIKSSVYESTTRKPLWWGTKLDQYSKDRRVENLRDIPKGVMASGGVQRGWCILQNQV